MKHGPHATTQLIPIYSGRFGFSPFAEEVWAVSQKTKPNLREYIVR